MYLPTQEGVRLASYLLIGFWYDKEYPDPKRITPSAAGVKAFMTTRVGDAGFMLALAIMWTTAGTFDLETGIWDWLRDGESPVQMGFYSPPRWSSTGDEILYTDPEGDLVIWNLVDGSRRTVGSGTFADWQRDVVVGVCGDGDCSGSESLCSCPEDCGRGALPGSTPRVT